MTERNPSAVAPDAPDVHRVVTVPLTPERAFEVFVTRFDDIKPREHNLLRAPIVETSVDRHVGGTIHDVAEDGSRCDWARILAFDPPHRIVFSWDIGPTWEIESDPDRTSEVEVTFTPAADGGTRLDLVHRHLERHGPGWESVHGGVDDEAGWTLYLDRYLHLAQEAA
ncbi:SRPBCC family protein [Phycicoccus sp.]|uniref:SRPBCC family protein n=1 Tax=Phycicoccus sp. TaxID=1902410 RepID=UPI002C43DCB7|nr:SRPBCC family protein [Phycicoccus sp.]HMM94974.1 SRPBCC family protein [Phycicoccus sp.]